MRQIILLHRLIIANLILFVMGCGSCFAQNVQDEVTEPKSIEQLVVAAETLAVKDDTGALASALILCKDVETWGRELVSFYKRIEPTKVFDNLYFVGTEFVGVWVLETSEGLILFDAMGNSTDAAYYVEGGLAKLGLDPDQIKYIVVTHGHWDHYGGARYLQSKYDFDVVMGKADRDAFQFLPEQGLERMGIIPPEVDIAVDAPTELVLGDVTVKLFPTPGHSPGTLSALVPVQNGEETYFLALWGGTAMPRTVKPSQPKIDGSWYNMGFMRYRQSLIEFRTWVYEDGGEGVISTHPFSDGTLLRLAALSGGNIAKAHPFFLGTDLTRDYFTVIDYCAQVGLMRLAQ